MATKQRQRMEQVLVYRVLRELCFKLVSDDTILCVDWMGHLLNPITPSLAKKPTDKHQTPHLGKPSAPDRSNKCKQHEHKGVGRRVIGHSRCFWTLNDHLSMDPWLLYSFLMHKLCRSLPDSSLPRYVWAPAWAPSVFVVLRLTSKLV